MFKRCFTPTFSETELPPQEPHPRVREGVRAKLYISPIPPCEEGVLIRIRHVFIASWNMAILSCSVPILIYNDDVCPYPPSAIRRFALASASSKSLDLYMARTGESFSCANSSERSTEVTSPMRILVFSGTVIPASLPIV